MDNLILWGWIWITSAYLLEDEPELEVDPVKTPDSDPLPPEADPEAAEPAEDVETEPPEVDSDAPLDDDCDEVKVELEFLLPLEPPPAFS